MKTQATFSDKLKDFQVQQLELADILVGASNVTRRLHMSVEQELATLGERVKNDSFKVMVTGTFKNGKSALINALLGEDILPSYALPCTAVINEIKYGKEKKAILHFKRLLPTPLPEELADRAVRHMEKYKGREIPPLEIPYGEIKDYVVIPVGADAEQMKLQSPYEKVELFYPLEILKNGIEIIDSPGLNEDAARTRTTMAYLGHVDAVLYVFNASAIAAADEMRFVEDDLAGNNYDAVVFAINKIDQIDEDQRDAIRRYAEKKLSKIYPAASVFSLSAKNALAARKDRDPGKLKYSGLLELEEYLSDFLTRERGKAKLVQPAKRLRQILSVDAVGKAIPTERSMLDKSLAEVEKKQKEILPRLTALEKERDVKKLSIETQIERCGRKIERLAQRKILGMADSVRTWIDECQPKNKIGFIPTQKSTTPVVNELADYIKAKIKTDQAEWQKAILEPEITEAGKKIFNSAERDFSSIFAEIDEITINLNKGDGFKANAVPFWQRVAGVTGGLVTGNIDIAIYGGVNGLGKEFFKNMAIEIAAFALLFGLELLNPFTIWLVIGGLFLRGMRAGSNAALQKLKAALGDHAISEIKKNADAQAGKIADGIISRFGKITDQISSAVGSEIEDLKRQFQVAVNEKKSGESACNKRRKELADCEDVIRKLNGRLDDLIFKLADV